MASQSSVEFEKDSTVDVGGLHENDEPCPWMSQLFEKLDLEVDKGISSTEKTTSPKYDANPPIWGIGSLAKECLACMHPAGQVSMCDEDNYLSCHTRDNTVTGFKSSTCTRCNKTLPVPDSMTQFRPLIGARYPVPDVEAKEYYRTKKRVTYKETHENEMEHMSEECLLAFRNYVQIYSLKDTEHKFGELWCHCFGVQAPGKIYKHFNFTMQTKLRNSDIWTSKLYFAEVKQLFGVMYYFCCPLEASDDGDCYQCDRQQIGDLKHPSRGGYEDGYSITLDSFMVDYSSDSDMEKDELSSSVPKDHWLTFVS